MPRKSNPNWTLHTNVLRVVNTPGQAGTGTRLWQCKYCGYEQTSTITRVIKHLTGIVCTNHCAPCDKVPKPIADQLISENHPAMATTVRGSQSSQDALHDAFVGEFSEFEPTSEEGASTQPSSSGTRKRVHSGESQQDDFSRHDRGTGESQPPRQTTLPGRVSSQMWIKERQRVAEMEIARTLIECNISFNVLRTEHGEGWCEQFHR